MSDSDGVHGTRLPAATVANADESDGHLTPTNSKSGTRDGNGYISKSTVNTPAGVHAVAHGHYRSQSQPAIIAHHDNAGYTAAAAATNNSVLNTSNVNSNSGGGSTGGANSAGVVYLASQGYSITAAPIDGYAAATVTAVPTAAPATVTVPARSQNPNQSTTNAQNASSSSGADGGNAVSRLFSTPSPAQSQSLAQPQSQSPARVAPQRTAHMRAAPTAAAADNSNDGFGYGYHNNTPSKNNDSGYDNSSANNNDIGYNAAGNGNAYSREITPRMYPAPAEQFVPHPLPMAYATLPMSPAYDNTNMNNNTDSRNNFGSIIAGDIGVVKYGDVRNTPLNSNANSSSNAYTTMNNASTAGRAAAGSTDDSDYVVVLTGHTQPPTYALARTNTGSPIEQQQQRGRDRNRSNDAADDEEQVTVGMVGVSPLPVPFFAMSKLASNGTPNSNRNTHSGNDYTKSGSDGYYDDTYSGIAIVTHAQPLSHSYMQVQSPSQSLFHPQSHSQSAAKPPAPSRQAPSASSTRPAPSQSPSRPAPSLAQSQTNPSPPPARPAPSVAVRASREANATNPTATAPAPVNPVYGAADAGYGARQHNEDETEDQVRQRGGLYSHLPRALAGGDGGGDYGFITIRRNPDGTYTKSGDGVSK